MSNVPLPLAMPQSKIRANLKLGIGKAWLRFNPAASARLLAGELEFPLSQLHRCALLALAHQAELEGAPERMLAVHRRFWAESSQGPQHLRDADWRFSQMFLGHHKQIVPRFAEALRLSAIHRIVEIGCGRGEVLDHLSRELTTVETFVGLDLNAAMVAANSARNVDPRIQYVCADAGEWVQADATGASILTGYFVYGGVLEYLPRQTVQDMFNAIARQPGGAVIGLVEPVGDDHDFDSMPQSIPYGAERSMSHNYFELLKMAGLTVTWKEDKHSGSQRWVLLVAKKS